MGEPRSAPRVAAVEVVVAVVGQGEGEGGRRRGKGGGERGDKVLQRFCSGRVRSCYSASAVAG